MSRKGDCYDNAPMESFWGLLKTELVYCGQYESHAVATRDITEYIEIFYNRQRRQAALGYLSPLLLLENFKKSSWTRLHSLASEFDDLSHFESVIQDLTDRDTSAASS